MQLLRGNNPGRTPYALRFAGPIDSEFQNVSGNRGRVHASTHCRPKLVTYGRAGRQAAALPGGPPRPKPYRYWTRPTAPDSSDARELRELHILQRQFAHPLAAGREDGVGDGRRNGRGAAFADAAPFLAARRHEINLDFGCFGLTHDSVSVEVQLLHLAGFDRHLAIE